MEVHTAILPILHSHNLHPQATTAVNPLDLMDNVTAVIHLDTTVVDTVEVEIAEAVTEAATIEDKTVLLLLVLQLPVLDLYSNKRLIQSI